MKIEYDLHKNYDFLISSQVLYFVNYDFYSYILVKNNQCMFFSSILYAYKFFYKKILKYLSCIVS